MKKRPKGIKRCISAIFVAVLSYFGLVDDSDIIVEAKYEQHK